MNARAKIVAVVVAAAFGMGGYAMGTHDGQESGMVDMYNTICEDDSFGFTDEMAMECDITRTAYFTDIRVLPTH